MAKENMFAAASKKRAEQMDETTKVVETGEKKTVDSKTVNNARTVLSLSISVADKKRLQMKALEEGTTAAALVSRWIHEFC